jgi:transglutaminase-like putative cysteine protease
MYYSIRHLTKFLYSNQVSESVMETRMHPRSDQNQRCMMFHLSVSPRCRVFSYRDHLANHVHHFDIPGMHGQLVIVAESLVEVQPAVQVPAFMAPDAWADLDAMVEQGDYWETFDAETTH